MLLLNDQKTHEPAYDEISQLVITASPDIAKSIAEEILIHLPKIHSNPNL